MRLIRTLLIWAALGAAIAVPIVVAASSPLLAWREPVYIASGLAGVIGMALILVQPLLAAGYLPGLPIRRGRHVHRWVGTALVTAVVAHVAGLWVTSPPDVIDALLFASPTPFSAWGVIAMWGLFAAAAMAAVRHSLRLPPLQWRLGHSALVTVVVAGSVVHAMLIDGTMGTASKAVLCALALAATVKALIDRRAWTALRRRRS
ncbi:ferric reductase-like transmembrane domain-containing protein [Roseovarius tibetensis]|uniref:ferric reductase-like transmembrane domain-containing protein n=1 Tax=Roseovarius tibetensis TaxID=2685897 RepID=UPI003D7FC0BC